MDEKFVDIVEIWETEGTGDKKVAKKLLAVLANGYPIYVESNYAIELTKRSEKEAEEIKRNLKK